MAPSNNPHVSSQLRHFIYYHLDNNLLKNALFLAGRLHAYEPRSSEACYLLALCQYQSGQVKAAYDTIKAHASRTHHLGCSYVFAQACLDLGRDLEGISSLDRCRTSWQQRNTFGQHSESRRQHLPDAAAVYTLLGKLWNAHKDYQRAVECWVEALNLNPFIWDAFQGICDAGCPINVPNIYKISPEMIDALCPPAQEQKQNATIAQDKSRPPAASLAPEPQPGDPFSSASSRLNGGMTHGGSVLWHKLNGSVTSFDSENAETRLDVSETPSTQNGDFTATVREDSIAEDPFSVPTAPARKANRGPDFGLEFGAPPKMRNPLPKTRTRGRFGTEEVQILQAPEPTGQKRTISGQTANSNPNMAPAPTRRSDRLRDTTRPTGATSSKLSSFTGALNGFREGRDIKKAKATGTKGRLPGTSTVGRVVSGNRDRKLQSELMEVDGKDSKASSVVSRGVTSVPQKNTAQDKAKENEALQYLCDLFTKLSMGSYNLSRYSCQDAISVFNTLPSSQRETSWVQSQIGRAYFEQADYNSAERFFARARDLEASRLEDMEYYSTALWHLRSDIDLAFLAHSLMDTERLAPQSWCAIGNAFSLAREHDQAIKCFRRATQLDPSFAYGFTLQGHEYMSNEEYDKALDAYRNAISADRRHYNAWYGLGKVYEKNGKYDFAQQHYQTASSINPANAVLVCCIGIVLEKLKNPQAALDFYSRACTLAPTQALSRFKKARVLMALNEPKRALVELQTLKNIVPDEANVHFLLGRLYKMLRNKGEAIKSFTAALNLDPKAAQYIKDAMESLDDEDEDEYEEEED
ncbi:MAG: hypothetical protein Q9227_003117 [Pyrenula ochraceoflavens]